MYLNSITANLLLQVHNYNVRTEQEILIVDLETTGIGIYDKILEVGIVSLNIVTGEIIVLYDKLVKETDLKWWKLESFWVVQQGYIKAAEVLNAQPLEVSIIQNIINRYPLGITAFNNTFDYRYLEYAGINIPVKLPCLMQASKDTVKAPYKDKRKEGYKVPSAKEAYQYFFPNDVEYVDKHRGCDDAIHEAMIAYELIKLNKLKVK